jgi:hypothetical protein
MVNIDVSLVSRQFIDKRDRILDQERHDIMTQSRGALPSLGQFSESCNVDLYSPISNAISITDKELIWARFLILTSDRSLGIGTGSLHSATATLNQQKQL